MMLQGDRVTEFLGFSGFDLKPDVLRRVPRALALRYDVLPLAVEGSVLTVAVPDAADADVLDRLRLATGQEIRPVEAPRDLIKRHVTAIFAPTETGPARVVSQSDAPAVRILDSIHDRAVLASASDLHIEPTRDGGRVRHRVDGILREVMDVPVATFAPLVSRIKLLAGMDISDKRQPQDGRYTLELHGRSIDARVSSMPTIWGEKLVVRLLDHHVAVPRLEHLGMPHEFLERFRHSIHAPHGFVVVSGPTGSGKTTTLYASISERNVSTQNICSVEDPVEIRIPNVSQVQVNARAGLTFASALRSFWRQDPNVIMIGEVRDSETANVAVSAALSGQFVLTTLHSNDAPRTIARLVDIGVDPHTLACALTAVVAQRLVRKLCLYCREPAPRGESLESGGSAFRAAGCSRCAGTGYRGRTGIFEFLFVDETIRDAIAAGGSAMVAAVLDRSSYQPMEEDALGKVARGLTSFEEVQRVLGYEKRA